MAYLWTCPACGRAQRRDGNSFAEQWMDQLRAAAAGIAGAYFGPAIRHCLAMMPGTCRNIDCAASYEAHLWSQERERRAAMAADLAAGRIKLPDWWNGWPRTIPIEMSIPSPSDDMVDAVSYAMGWLAR